MCYNAIRKVDAVFSLEVINLSRIFDPINANYWIDAYLSGGSVNNLSKQAGTGRRAFTSFLQRNEISLRTQSEAEKVKWVRMTPEQRQQQVKAAHDASRGVSKSFEAKCKTALSVEKSLANQSPYEIILLDSLRRAGYSCTPQKAIGPYNTDAAVGNIAVEVWGGEWHFSGHHAERTPERFRYILDQGWHILVIVSSSRFALITEDTAQHVIAQLNILSSTKPKPRQYRMIGGNGEFLLAGSSQDDEISIVLPFTHGRNSKGQYTRVYR